MTTKIAWTDETWNPIVGCTRVSDGCRSCYAERSAYRLEHGFKQPQYQGTTKKVGGEIRWTGKVNLAEHLLDKPLHWRKPRRVFVNSMSDLFHESVPDEWIDRIFAVMALSPEHTFQVLTKRPGRMRSWFRDEFTEIRVEAEKDHLFGELTGGGTFLGAWPLPNVWLGVSCENQETTDERLPILLDTPAAVRWVSAEPLLGPIDFTNVNMHEAPRMRGGINKGAGFDEGVNALNGREVLSHMYREECRDLGHGLDWIVVGGESGPGARPCDIAWIRSIVEQCKGADVSVFVKQLGARPADGNLCCHDCRHPPGPHPLKFEHPKGGDPNEWEPGLRVREMPP